MAESEQRVCPRCGRVAGGHSFCPECGYELRAHPKLPTRAQWVESVESGTDEVAQPVGDAGAGTQRGLRRLLRPLPLAAIGGGIVLLFAIVLLAGGGDRSDVEQRLEEQLAAAPYGAGDPSVECPEGSDDAPGERLQCQASAADGTSAAVEAAVEPGSGELRIENLVPVERIATECREEMLKLARRLGSASSCEVDCPDLVEAAPNGLLTCSFTLDDDRGTVRIPLAADGISSQGRWEAELETP